MITSNKKDYPLDVLRRICVRNWPEPAREHVFYPERDWRLDLAYVDARIAIECHGGIFTHGRHTRGKGFIADREKMNQAVVLGWIVIEIACPMAMDSALGWIDKA